MEKTKIVIDPYQIFIKNIDIEKKYPFIDPIVLKKIFLTTTIYCHVQETSIKIESNQNTHITILNIENSATKKKTQNFLAESQMCKFLALSSENAHRNFFFSVINPLLKEQKKIFYMTSPEDLSQNDFQKLDDTLSKINDLLYLIKTINLFFESHIMLYSKDACGKDEFYFVSKETISDPHKEKIQSFFEKKKIPLIERYRLKFNSLSVDQTDKCFITYLSYKTMQKITAHEKIKAKKFLISQGFEF